MKKLDLWFRRYFQIRNELSIVDECLMYGDRVVVPKSLRNRVLWQLHKGHPGRDQMTLLARSYVFWAGMQRDIENYVASCEECAKNAKMPVKTTLKAWPPALGPMDRVHIDFAGPFMGENFLVFVDAYSNWPDITRMTSTSTVATIKVLRQLFTKFGYPKCLVSDNGSQFTPENGRRVRKVLQRVRHSAYSNAALPPAIERAG